MSEKRTRMRERMMAHLDGELGIGEVEEFERVLAADAELRREFEGLVRLKTVTRAVKMRTPPDKIWEDYMNSVYLRVERGVGWILLSLGATVLLAYGLWTGVRDLINSSQLEWYMKAAILSVLIGLAVIVVSVVREKLFMRGKDPYREVER